MTNEPKRMWQEPWPSYGVTKVRACVKGN